MVTERQSDMYSGKKVTKTDQKYIVLMYKGGLSFSTIGRILGFAPETIAMHYRMELQGRSNKYGNSVDWSKVRTGLGNVPRGDD